MNAPSLCRVAMMAAALTAVAAQADRILFVSSNGPDRVCTLFTMNPDGSDIQRVYTNTGILHAWSPDITGTHVTNAVIAVVDRSRASSNIFLTDLQGSGPVCLNNTNKAMGVQFDGPGEVYFLADTPPSYQVWKINSTGSGEQRVFNNDFDTFPLGSQSFFLHEPSQTVYLSSFNAVIQSSIFKGATGALSAAETGITSNNWGDHYNPAVSPDGLSIAYSVDHGTGDHRIVISPNINGTTNWLEVAPVFCGSPSWSSDGTWLAFARAPSSTFGGSPYIGWMCTVQADGSGETNATIGVTEPFDGSQCCFPIVYDVAVFGTATGTHYVSFTGTHIPPFTNWLTAATNIQAAVDASFDGDRVLVSNGVYSTGERVAPLQATLSRVVVTTAITLCSLEGAEHTVIAGTQAPLGDALGNGTNAVRCLFIGTGIVRGFTFSNGHTHVSGDSDNDRSGGGISTYSRAYGATIADCILCDNAADFFSGGCYGGMLTNCILMGNQSSWTAGGANAAELNHCTVVGNAGNYAGGLYNCDAFFTTIISNTAESASGGVDDCALYFCTVAHNTAVVYGGGATYSSLFNCRVTDNISDFGGGVYDPNNLDNCLVVNNTATSDGGGVYETTAATALNCTIVSNTAARGGGVFNVALRNCIVMGNTAPDGLSNYFWSSGPVDVLYSCTAPLATGDGNIAGDPLFANALTGDYHLQASSPCREAGSNVFAPLPWDLDGNPRILPQPDGIVDMGCFEFVPEPAAAAVLFGCLLAIVRSRRRAGTALPFRPTVTHHGGHVTCRSSFLEETTT